MYFDWQWRDAGAARGHLSVGKTGSQRSRLAEQTGTLSLLISQGSFQCGVLALGKAYRYDNTHTSKGEK